MSKLKKTLIFIILLIIIISIFLFVFINKNKRTNRQEYLPEEEISIQEERKTMVTLYFKNKETQELEAEQRLIDVKELLENPYKSLLELLQEKPKNENLEQIIPEGTQLLDIEIENGNLKIGMANETIKLIDKDISEPTFEQIKESISRTMMELAEVNSVEIIFNEETI